MTDRCLGKQPHKPDPRVPRMRTVLTRPEALPADCNWTAGVTQEWGMLGNDVRGNCVPCGALHAIMQRLSYAQRPVNFSDADALVLYRRWNPAYDPADPTTDVGCVMSDAMSLWASVGIPLPDGGTDRVSAYCSVDHTDLDRVKTAIWHFGSALVGIQCPARWLDEDYLFDLTAPPDDIVGGHCVLLCGWTLTALGDEFDIITWGKRYRVTDRALRFVLDEAWAVIDQDWMSSVGLDPAGVAWNVAEAAMITIRTA